jgi:hypothetical protein
MPSGASGLAREARRSGTEKGVTQHVPNAPRRACPTPPVSSCWYNGTGRLHYPDPCGVDDHYLINCQYFPGDGFLRDPERYGTRADLARPAAPTSAQTSRTSTRMSQTCSWRR